MKSTLSSQSAGESDESENLELMMTRGQHVEGLSLPEEEGFLAESREGCPSEVEGRPYEEETAVLREYNYSSKFVSRSKNPANIDEAPLDQYTNGSINRYQNSTGDPPSRGVYQSSNCSFENCMPNYHFSHHSQIPYEYRRRFPPLRERKSFEHEIAWLKGELARKSNSLSEKDSLLIKKDRVIHDLRKALAKAKIEIDKAIVLEKKIKDEKSMVAELLSIRDELAEENWKLRIQVSEVNMSKEQPPEPPPIDLDSKELYGWDPADLEMLSTFDFHSTVYRPDQPVYKVRKVNGINATWRITRMCLNFVNGRCHIGKNCIYGHCTKELAPHRVHNYKQVPCSRTTCRRAVCNMRHGEMRRKLLSDFFLVYGGVIDAPRLCFYPTAPVAEKMFKKYLHEVLDRLDRVLPKRLLPAQVVIPFQAFV